MNTILKTTKCLATYNEFNIDSSMAGFDDLDVSRRSLQRMDFHLTDSYGKYITLNSSHWSMFIICQNRG